ncbi:hypothetical protein [Phaffia rhodozyma]|uniref:Uncharacterized protein n=1 Tax=Phaffia rhodozyma TaxID=264483 RepID=A0A0F7SXP8_PHARH|nr:hypothetical protein [Phaffia rhodozyma]
MTSSSSSHPLGGGGESLNVTGAGINSRVSPVCVPDELLRDSEIIYSDSEVTALLENAKGRKLASAGHITLLIAQPLSTVYDFSPASIPLLSRLLQLSHNLLHERFIRSSASLYPYSSAAIARSPSPGSSSTAVEDEEVESRPVFPPRPQGSTSLLTESIGFVVGPFKDPLNASLPYLTLHAFLGPLDLASFYIKNFPFGPLGFYKLEDLIAEIRESTSNNRIKSGSAYKNPRSSGIANMGQTVPRPLDQVPAAGAREGLPNGGEFHKVENS